MATSDQLRSWWATYRCNTSKMTRVAFPGVDRSWDLLVATEARPAWLAFAAVMASEGYLFRESAGGTYNCRPIAGTTKYSLHSYGIAIDLNPSKNPYGKPLRTDLPQSFRERIGSIQANGKRCFEWGGSWTTPDAMHFELDVSPADIAKGVTFDNGTGENDMQSLRLLVAEAIQKGWLGWPDEGTFWLNLCETPNDPQWRNNFEPAWNTWKLAEAQAIAAGGGTPPDLSGYAKVGHDHNVTGTAK